MTKKKLYEVIACMEDYYKFEYYANNEDEACEFAVRDIYSPDEDEPLSLFHMTENSGVRIESVKEVGEKSNFVIWYNLVRENIGSIGAYDTVDEALTAFFNSPKEYYNHVIEIMLTQGTNDTLIDKIYPEKIVYGDY